MKILVWVMALSLMVFIMTSAVSFHRATVCRQVAWERSFLSFSQSLFPKARPTGFIFEKSCGVTITRRGSLVHWFSGLKPQRFELKVRGKL